MGHSRKWKRRKGIWWDYNGDGMFSAEVLTAFWKRYWRKWLSRKSREDIEERMEEREQ